MSDVDREATGIEGVAEAVVEQRRRPSIVWLIPLVAALVGGFVAWRTFSERGPAITITFESAEGLEAGKTQLKYKDVAVGLVEEVQLAPDLSNVIVGARMVKGAERYLTEGTRFWVVRPRLAGGQVTGLGTLFSGAYIGLDPVRDGKRTRSFTGLEVPPVVTTDEAGRHFVLHSHRAGSLDVGTPVFFRKISVGRVVASELDASGEFVTIRIFVDAPHHDRVSKSTRFWNASGFDATISAEGVSIDTESVVSILTGGIGFDTPDDRAAEPAPDETVFSLYENFAATKREIYKVKARWLLHFDDQSVRGLHAGSPVEFEGIPVGQVHDVRLEVDPAAGRFRIPVVIEIEPERIGGVGGVNERRAMLDRLVSGGLRAQLATGNLLTGELVVSLQMQKDAAPAQVAWDSQPYPEFPTVPTPLEQITSSLTHLVKRLEQVPLDEIAGDLRDSLVAVKGTLASAQATLAQADRTLATASGAIGPESPLYQELQRTLAELTETARSLGLAAEQIEQQPNSLIFGRGDE